MNKYVKASIASLATATILFFLMAFINATINPFKWEIAARFLLSVGMFIFGLCTFRFTLNRIDYDKEEERIAKEFDLKRKARNTFVEKLDEMAEEARKQTEEIRLNRVAFMTENSLNLLKLSKEDFRNL